jgi:5'(3')-deoxyribonucleotidase
MRPDFLVDVDEVLCDFQNPAFALIKEVTGMVLTPEDFDTWDIFSCLKEHEADEVFNLMEQPGFCASLQPAPGAVEFIQEMREYANVYVVTSPQHNRHWVYERTEWLRENFDLQKKQIIHTAAKYMVQGDAFLDDKPEHIENWSKKNPNGLAMLWHTPNTRNLGQGLLRVKTWAEVLEQVRTKSK